MKQLLILFIFFAFTKEKISYKSKKIYSYEDNCLLIEKFFDSVNPPNIDDYPLNAQYCRLNDPNINELTVKEPSTTKPTTTEPPTIEITNIELTTTGGSDGSQSTRNLEDSQNNKDKCCYISILPNSDNSDWIYFCGKISSAVYESGVSEYVKQIKNGEDFKNKYKDIKIDCFSQKLDFMINVLILSLIFLI